MEKKTLATADVVDQGIFRSSNSNNNKTNETNANDHDLLSLATHSLLPIHTHRNPKIIHDIVGTHSNIK